ncbi:MAG: hypothetical protein ABI972_11140 [Acidobacteriota bacterium]
MVYLLAPLAMVALALTLLGAYSELHTCSDCDESWRFASTLLVSTTLGWFLYYALVVLTVLKRLFVK